MAALLIGISIAHVLKDMVYEIPSRLGFDVSPAAAMVGLAYLAYTILVRLAGRDRSVGYLGNLVAGVFWFAAAAYGHLEEVLFAEDYRAGLISKSFQAELI